MEWKDVGDWLKDNAGESLALVGSLLTGNVPGAVAAGIGLVSSATGKTNPGDVLASLQQDPATRVRLEELAQQNRESIRTHIENMARIELEREEMITKDAQHEHHETQETIRNADRAEDKFVRRTRPGQSWVSLIAGISYVFAKDAPSIEIVIALFTLPWAYAGLRQVGKGIDSAATGFVKFAARKYEQIGGAKVTK